MTPAPILPVSILKSSRTRSLSLSSNRESSLHPRSTEPRRPNLGKSHTTTVINKAPLKEESISLSWPLVRWSANPKRKQQPLLYFDIGFDPRHPQNLRDKRMGGDWLLLSDTDRRLPASTHCTLTEMFIDCPLIGLITVKRAAGIRCIDVFRDIYDAYRRRLREDEAPQDISRYYRFFEQRCLDSPGPDAEKRAGMRRVDLLRGHRFFDGLSRSGADWKLEFARMA
ncbi:hypothetical protein C8R43DRAFT_282450 [Mycena crocata]|nr:hypothetical protein C8R43DRAFT_282450 [Mycena crocata]